MVDTTEITKFTLFQGRADAVGALSLGWKGAHILCLARRDARGGGSSIVDGAHNA